ncbi:MAG: homoserine kinase [Actinomycetota bacterium]
MKATAPASTANLGPGFDCFGAAVNLSVEIELGDGDLPKIVQRAIRAVAGDVDVGGTLSSEIPPGRGLGSSGALIAAGLMLGCAIAEREPDRDELLLLGTPIEGHPDNLAASLFGGITNVLPDSSVMRFDPSDAVHPLILVPAEQLATKKARKALPESVPHRDAVVSVARSAGLLAMLTGAAQATPERLLECTEDVLHQPYRAELMPKTTEAIAQLRGLGIAAAVSGAGPSIVCLVVRAVEGIESRIADALEGWRHLDLDWDLGGAKVVR